MSAELVGRERREHVRVPLTIQVEGADFGLGETRDLSLGGAYVSLQTQLDDPDQAPDMGTVLGLCLQLPGVQEAVKISGRVVRLERDAISGRVEGVGIEFQDVSEMARRALEVCVDEQLQDLDTEEVEELVPPPPPDEESSPDSEVDP